MSAQPSHNSVPSLRLGQTTQVFFGHKTGKYPDGNQVIVRGADTCIAFDTPLVSRHLISELTRADLIVLSHVHEDHTVALGRLQHVPVQAHEADCAAAQSWAELSRRYGYRPQTLAQLHTLIQRDFDYMPRPDATPYADGAHWDLGGGVRIRAHHLPGHTAGHCALVVENDGIAFIGDIDLTGFGPYYGDATSDLQQFRHSLQRVRELDAQTWITSHHKGVIQERATFLQLLERFTSKLDERNDKLLAYLEERPHSLPELAERRILYPPSYNGMPFVADAEARTIALHLAELQGSGTVREDDGIWYRI